MRLNIGVRAIIASTLIVGVAHATNGYLTAGTGINSDGMAGAGSADPSEIMLMATNPAALALVGQRVELGLALFSPDRSYSTSPSLANGNGGAFTIGPNDITSGDRLFPIPYFAMNWQLDRENSLGAAFYGRGGMNTTWEGGTATFAPRPGFPPATFPGTYGAGTAGVNLLQAFLNLTYAHSFAERQFSLGVSLIGAAQRFDARGVATFAPYTYTFAASGGTVMPTSLTNNGADMSYGGGGAVGLEWRPEEQFTAAVAYTSKMFMSKFTKYSDLFAEGGGFDIPATATIGVTVKPSPPVAVSFDVQRIWYADVASVGNPISNLFACPTAGAGGTDLQSCLGGNHGAGFGWRNMTVYKLGLRWQLDPDWTGRIGYSHGTQPIPGSEVVFNILAPGVVENHFAIGATRRNGDHGEFSAAFTYVSNKSIQGVNTFDPTQTITLQMHQFVLEFGYAWMR
jgi:long-chain fatty acid transport protein